jgi:site-specific DNA-adenine methylase
MTTLKVFANGQWHNIGPDIDTINKINKNFKILANKIEELESRLEKLENRNTPTGNDYFDEIRRQIEEDCYF